MKDKKDIPKIIIAVVIVCAIIAIHAHTQKREFLKVKTSNGEIYHVLEKYDDKQETAEMLRRVNEKGFIFLEILKKKYHVNASEKRIIELREEMNPIQRNLHDIVDRIITRYNYENLFETEPTGKNGTSYTVEKGKQLHMCTRDKHTSNLHSEHEIMFVLLHELAHMGNLGWGHERDFWEVFKFLLIEANESGVHTSIDYSQQPIVYCGLPVDYNPFFDRGIADLRTSLGTKSQ